ncbi:MAG: hypothetical protein NC041_02570 [Bacteroides sp.]|nr:hypothetical protein [Prevotella sp.]MCM1408501.1 hypothetical protein [Treponema brennaborense]MCM1469338.1 hypothetical protein [Bacteroides sp.]
MKKRFFVLFFAAFLMLLTAGCSDDPSDSGTNGNSTVNPAVKPSNTPENSTALSVTAGGGSMTIVVPDSLTGSDASGSTIIASKDDLVKCIKNIIKKYDTFCWDTGLFSEGSDDVAAESLSASRSVSASRASVSKPSASAIANGFIKITDFFRNNEDKIYDFFVADNPQSFDFSHSMDYTDISIQTGADAYIDLIREYDDKDATLNNYFGENASSVIKIADNYASFPKLALKTNLTGNANKTTPADSNLVLDIACDVNAEVHDIDNLIKDLLEEWNRCNTSYQVTVPSSVDLPVKSVSVGLTCSVNADITQARYQKWADTEDPPYRWDYHRVETGNQNYPYYWVDDYETIEDYVAALDAWLENDVKNISGEKCSAELGFAVSVAAAPDGNVPGGIITLSFAKSYKPADIKTFIRDFYLLDAGDDLYIIKQIDGGTCTKLTVSDFSGNQKFSLGSGQNVIGEIEDICEDIERNIGELIQ